MEDGQKQSLGDYLNQHQRKATTQFDIVTTGKILEEQQVILNNSIPKITQQCKQDDNQRDGHEEYWRAFSRQEAMILKLSNKTLLELYCRAASEVKYILETSLSNFQSHAHRFLYGDRKQVKHPVSLLYTQNNYMYVSHGQTQMTDTLEWLPHYQRDKDPNLEGLKTFWEEMLIRSSDLIRKCNPALKCIMTAQESVKSLVRVYINRTKAI